MAKKAYLYCDPRVLNDATNYYIEIVTECLKELDFEIKTVHRLKEIKKPDLIFTVSINNYTYSKLKFPFVKAIMWKQGLSLAEAKLNRPFYKWLPLMLGELFTVTTSDLLLFVSEGMLEYYTKYYFYRGRRHYIMPCFNMSLGKYNGSDRYKTPSFVYAGSISKWQCVDQVLDSYAIIEHEIPEARLVMYCKDRNLVIEKAKERGIKNLEVRYVTVEELSQELTKYKYGFLLRERNPVNYVSTPTKMNSYLSAYLIPIFSDAVRDFEDHIKLGQYTLKFNSPLSPKEIAATVIEFEKSITQFDDYPKLIKQVFEEHYNRKRYKEDIKDRIRKIIGN